MMSRSTLARTAQPGLDVPADTQTSEGLRSLLRGLHDQGQDAWAHDPAVTELMEYAREKYAALAMRHRLDPWEAASAAFDAMRTMSVREAADPWAVVTQAVRTACSIAERSQGLLCSAHQVRRSRFSGFHDPERFSDRDPSLLDYHPSFAALDPGLDDLDTAEASAESSCTSVREAVEATITLLVLLGWPPETARFGVERVCDALVLVGSRAAAFEALRHDRQVCALLDLPSPTWRSLLRVLLGNPEPAHAATPVGRGVLVRLLIGETISGLLDDDGLVVALSSAALGVRR